MNKKLLSSIGFVAIAGIVTYATLSMMVTQRPAIQQTLVAAATNTPAATPVAASAYPMQAPIVAGVSVQGTIYLRNEGYLPISSTGVLVYTPANDPNEYDKAYLTAHGWRWGCMGTTTQTSGIATTSGYTSCFTASTNVVQCTDSTAAAAVKCVAGAGTLTITGATGSDTIAFQRIQ